jgi:superfamily I DNA/RNA helicase
MDVARLFSEMGATASVKNGLQAITPRGDRHKLENLYKLLGNRKSGNARSIVDVSVSEISQISYGLGKLMSQLRLVMFDAEGREVDGADVKGLIVIYFHMMKEVYGGNSSYCVKVRAYLGVLLNGLKKGRYDSVCDFLMDMNVLSDKMDARLPQRDKKTGKIVKAKVDIEIATVHEYKGRESDSVYIWHSSEGYFPSDKLDMREAMQVAEERRLYYVALTRAKERCTVYALKGHRGIFFNELECVVQDGDGDRLGAVRLGDSSGGEETVAEGV